MIKVDVDRISYISSDGVERCITSPWSDCANPLYPSREMEGNWIFLGCCATDDGAAIDFISLRGLSELARWRIDDDGNYVSQQRLNASAAGIFAKRPMYYHMADPSEVAKFARRFSNDYQIYCAIKYIMGDPVYAQSYLDTYAPGAYHATRDDEVTGGIKLYANIIFNHNYSRNIPAIDKLYEGRFSAVNYILPNAAPQSERCSHFPAGSFAYHTLIYMAAMKLLGDERFDESGWYMFCQDDVYLNKNFSCSTFSKFVNGAEPCAAFYCDVISTRWDYNSSWAWNTRALGRIKDPRSFELGNGFEGYNAFFDIEALSSAVGDIFFVSGKYLREFCEILGNYISEDVFPEISIPSSLSSLCCVTGRSLARFSGMYLWGDERSVLNSEYLSDFDTGTSLFIHPVKLDVASSSSK
ncbi:hypothetical protein G8E10_15060 [Rhizobiaceae bacterium CRRU44]|uniref:Glycosyltransferase n=1 Tax=Ferranicluibacter rubi TaxID=2715133 RepID=A0AA43ZG80_9HYPH|nr:hypothetical protein [Ferranicluibacter rubi]NHT77039.1 hypothetical protein [Ferranicluibacter rubi]